MNSIKPNSGTQTVYLGPPTVDHIAVVDAVARRTGSKITCGEIQSVCGGAAVNAVRAHQRLDDNVLLLPITGADSEGNQVTERLLAEFSNVRRIATASRTRQSLIVPRENNSPDLLTYTVRPVLDDSATLAAAAPFVGTAHSLFVGSMTAEATPLLHSLLDGFRGETSYLMLTDSQIAEWPTTRELCRRFSIVQMNHHELFKLTGEADHSDGIRWLREEGLPSFIVTLGAAGTQAFHDRASPYAPALDVECHHESGAGDTLAGTVLASLKRGDSFDKAIRLGSASAAMHVSGRHPSGWAELEHFDAMTPRRRYSILNVVRTPVQASSTKQPDRCVLLPAIYAASGALATLSVIGIVSSLL